MRTLVRNPRDLDKIAEILHINIPMMITVPPPECIARSIPTTELHKQSHSVIFSVRNPSLYFKIKNFNCSLHTYIKSHNQVMR